MKTLDVDATIATIRILTAARMQSTDVRIAWEYLNHAIERLDRELEEYFRDVA